MRRNTMTGRSIVVLPRKAVTASMTRAYLPDEVLPGDRHAPGGQSPLVSVRRGLPESTCAPIAAARRMAVVA